MPWLQQQNQKNPTCIASWWFYCSSRMAFLKMNFNGQARKTVLLYLCNWSLWNRIGKTRRIIGHILYLVNHRASAINIAAFGNLDLYPAFAKNIGNCLGSQMICSTGYLNTTLCKVFLLCILRVLRWFLVSWHGCQSNSVTPCICSD